MRSARNLVILAGFILIGFFIFQQARRKPRVISAPTTVVWNGTTMGGTYSVRYILADQVDSPGSAQDIHAAIEQVLQDLNAELSTWQADSEISRFNADRSQRWFSVSTTTVELVQQAAEWTKLSDGKFDVSIAPLIDAWGFGPAGPVTDIPSDATIAATLKHVGIDKLQWRADPPGLKKSDPELAIDLSAIGAGAAADRVSAKLLEFGLVNHYVDVTGEIVTHGHSATGGPWLVGIAEPTLMTSRTLATVALGNRAIATSGNYRNYLDINGRRVVHTLDATTGRPITTDVVSATVLADKCSDADGLATMLMTHNAQRGLELAEQHGWAVVLMQLKPDQTVQPLTSRAAEPFLYAMQQNKSR
ncbi:MAG: FAD:protein FMN transferase [Pirellulaceae bacterium]|nr:FAD:protein FMN transferase [Pirellulaceae bacterium]